VEFELHVLDLGSVFGSELVLILYACGGCESTFHTSVGFAAYHVFVGEQVHILCNSPAEVDQSTALAFAGESGSVEEPQAAMLRRVAQRFAARVEFVLERV
jgi:hypothetical protein